MKLVLRVMRGSSVFRSANAFRLGVFAGMVCVMQENPGVIVLKIAMIPLFLSAILLCRLLQRLEPVAMGLSKVLNSVSRESPVRIPPSSVISPPVSVFLRQHLPLRFLR